MKFVGVVVAYNPTDVIYHCIDSYLPFLKKLYVVDNSNTDHHKMFSRYSNVEYISNLENLGIAKALNIGAEHALKDKADWLLTMDQDSVFEGNNLKKLIDFVKICDVKKVGLVSPWHVTKEHKEKSTDDVEKVVEVMTSGNFVNLRAWKKVGGWKDWFFIDCVDIEFCMNLNIHHYDVLRYNLSLLHHNLGNIELHHLLGKEFACTNHNYIRQYYMIRNMYYLEELYKNEFPEKIYSMKRGAFGRFKNILVWEKDKYRKIRNMYRGYRDYKKGVKGKYPYSN